MYGLPKTHKPGTPLRPILSMTNAPTFNLAQWLTDLLQPIRDSVSNRTVADSFDFCDKIRSINLNDTPNHFCSFDAVSLFTNVPLEETVDMIKIIADKKDLDLRIPFDLLKRLVLLCTQNVQFSFNNKYYFQKDGVAMGSPLGPLLADIFMGYAENFLFDNSLSPLQYYRFVDDTFVVFRHRNEVPAYLSMLNSLHPSLQFTVEHENDNCLSFLDVSVLRSAGGFPKTTVYRKPTWSGLYLHFFSHAPLSYKRNLVHCLFQRAYRRPICSSDLFSYESNILTQTLLANGYPTAFITKYSQNLNAKEPQIGPNKKQLYLTVPFVNDAFSRQFLLRLNATVSRAFPAAEPRVFFTTSSISVRPLKDRIPLHRASNVLYKFSCGCGDTYIGRSERALSHRVGEHLPAWLLRGASTRPRSTAPPASAITRHVIDCPQFDRHNKIDHFKVLARARHRLSLPFLESTWILRMKPALCVHKEFVFTLKLPWR